MNPLFLFTNALGGLIFFEVIEVIFALRLCYEPADWLVSVIGTKIELLLWFARNCMKVNLLEELAAVETKLKASDSC